MCGDYDSVIGMKKEVAMQRFIRKMPGERLSPAEGEGTLCAAVVETDDRTGLAKSIRRSGWGGDWLRPPDFPYLVSGTHLHTY